MTDNRSLETSLLAPVILQAQHELMSPYRFYHLCHQVCQQSGKKRLYFCEPDSSLLDFSNGVGINELRKFFDYLAQYVRDTSQEGHQETFYLQRVRLKLRCQTKKATLITNYTLFRTKMLLKKKLNIEVEIAGAGMIGRVARVRINQGKDLAFKAFFDPEFVWKHGPWGEIPVGLRLKYCQVTKDMPEFLFAGQDWAVWEWIYPHTNPQSREGGITYEQFARQEGLTRLNPLNQANYNPYNMRLDPGGIQKNYWGRRFDDCIKGTTFYIRKARREGWRSLTIYLTWSKIKYLLVRLIALVVPGIVQTGIKSEKMK